MAIKLDQFSELINYIYDAALGMATWEEVLTELTAAFDGVTAAILVAKPGSNYILTTLNTGPDSEAIRNYNNYYGRFDETAAKIQQSRIGTILRNEQILTPPELRHSKFFNEWYRSWAKPRDIGNFIVSNMVRKEDKVNWLVITFSTSRRQSFSTTERIKLMRQFLPHIQKAVQIRKKLDELPLKQYSALEALAKLAYGVILFSDTNRAIFINPAAEVIFNLFDGLTIDKTGCLHARQANENLKLRRLIGAACQRNSDELRSGGSMLISRRSFKRAFFLHILPLGTGLSSLTDFSASAMALIIDPENIPEPPLSVLRNLFGLTPAEAEVALHVIKDEGLQDVADKLSVSLSTVRIHLQRVFEKTGTHRQAGLTRLLSALHAGVDTDTNLK